MIRVVEQTEPTGFNEKVRLPGASFLKRNPNPNNRLFQKHNYWKHASNELHAAYGGICAYSCIYLVNASSVDHFQPKSKFPNLAYEWSNYRLASRRINSYKGDSLDVLDPFKIEIDWFILDFPSCLVRPAVGLSESITKQIVRTIDILRLNSDDSFVQERCDILVDFSVGHVTLEFLQKRYPFLAKEIVRHSIEKTANRLFKHRSP